MAFEVDMRSSFGVDRMSARTLSKMFLAGQKSDSDERPHSRWVAFVGRFNMASAHPMFLGLKELGSVSLRRGGNRVPI